MTIVGEFEFTDTLVRLPRDLITIQPLGDGVRVIASLFHRRGYRHYEIYPLSDLPNDLITHDDLKRFGIVVSDKESTSGY
jgi:hypothetical protein